MKRIAAVLGMALALSSAATAAAHADGGPTEGDVGCGGGYVAPAMSSHLAYRSASWTAGGGSLTVDAPKSWPFVHTAGGEGRFHSRSGLDLMSLAAVTDGLSPADHMADEVQQLAGTHGLRITGQRTKVVGHQTWSTLGYRYFSSMGEPREVMVRWIAPSASSGAEAAMVLTVAGRPLDGSGLDALLTHATATAVAAG